MGTGFSRHDAWAMTVGDTHELQVPEALPVYVLDLERDCLFNDSKIASTMARGKRGAVDTHDDTKWVKHP